MRAALLSAGAMQAVSVVGTVTVPRRRWLCIRLLGDGSCSERRGGGLGWVGLDFPDLKTATDPSN